MKNKLSAENLKACLGKYKFALIILAAGAVLLLLPTGERTAQGRTENAGDSGAESFSVEALEEKLSEVLSRVDGAGKVAVVLTVRSGMERVLATDRTASRSGEEAQSSSKTVTLTTDAGEEAVLLMQNYPVFQGALVVCPGGNDPQVRLQLTQALSVLTGLGADRITICSGS